MMPPVLVRVADYAVLASIKTNQAYGLLEKFKEKFPNEKQTIATLDQVALVTPENIYVNSFMYEPIIDMSDDHLRKLYGKVRNSTDPQARRRRI